MNEVIEFEPLVVPSEGPVQLRQVYQCRCGVKHPAEHREIYLLHQEFAPMRSTEAMDVRGQIKAYLDGHFSLDRLREGVAQGLRESSNDHEASQYGMAIDWCFWAMERGDVDGDGFKDLLRQLINKPPILVWTTPDISIPPKALLEEKP